MEQHFIRMTGRDIDSPCFQLCESEQQAYECVLDILNHKCVHFELWARLNIDYWSNRSDKLQKIYLDHYPGFIKYDDSGKISSYSRDSWYPSISFEQFSRLFDQIPDKAIDLLGETDHVVMGDIKWEVKPSRSSQSSPGLNREPVSIW